MLRIIAVLCIILGMLVERQKNQALLGDGHYMYITAYGRWLCIVKCSVLQEVCSQIYATLYDYPVLKDCQGLRSYVAACVQVAWGLSVQNPPFLIMYDARQFHPDLHVRFNTSDQESVTIKNFLWPALTEGYNGPCVYKGVVITWHPSSFSLLRSDSPILPTTTIVQQWSKCKWGWTYVHCNSV